MAATTLQDILDYLPSISKNRKYWFIRTQGGDFYENFINGGYIGIGYNRVSLSDIKAGNTNNETGIKILAAKIHSTYKEKESRPSYIASQLLKFTYQIKKGDIVLIPSQSSLQITFGEVRETIVYTDEVNDSDDCPFVKRKKVKWIKKLWRDDLDPNLYKLMFSHHTVSEADSYSEYIDKIINSFFIKNDKANLVLGVQTQEDIKAKDLFEMGAYSLELLDDFCAEENLPYNSNDVTVKLDVQSPGFILLTGVTMPAVILVGVIIIGIAGGGFYYTDKGGTKVGIKTDGIIEKVRSFLASKSNRNTKKQLLEKHLKDLQIKEPDDLVKVINELNK
jgi:hypothetical protein